MKVPRSLQPLVEDGLIDEVLRPLMAGKEAAVFIVVAQGDVCCAKVYKDAEHRSFKNRANYQEGRSVRSSRQARAMQRGTRFGKRELEEDWQNAEVDALYRLSAAGVRVPRPRQFAGGVLLMDLIVDAKGEAAPRLNDVALTPEVAHKYHQSLLRDVVKMLCAGLIHGDLSEYNVLVDADGPVIIDLPQAVDAAANNSAATMLRRDVRNLSAYFGRFAPELAIPDYGREIWQLYEQGKLQPDSELTGRYQQSARTADVGSVMRDIDDARRDNERRQPKPAPPRQSEKRGDEAWRGRVPEAEDAVAAKKPAASARPAPGVKPAGPVKPEAVGTPTTVVVAVAAGAAAADGGAVGDDGAAVAVKPWATQRMVGPSGRREVIDLRPPTPPKPLPPAPPPRATADRQRRRRGPGGEGGDAPRQQRTGGPSRSSRSAGGQPSGAPSRSSRSSGGQRAGGSQGGGPRGSGPQGGGPQGGAPQTPRPPQGGAPPPGTDASAPPASASAKKRRRRRGTGNGAPGPAAGAPPGGAAPSTPRPPRAARPQGGPAPQGGPPAEGAAAKKPRRRRRGGRGGGPGPAAPAAE